MASWIKKKFQSDPVTEFMPGPNLGRLQASLSGAVILALDISGSMAGSRIEEAKKGARRFIEEATAGGYSVGVILWSHLVDAVSPIEKSPRRALAMIDAASIGGGNDIVPTLREAHVALMAQLAADRVVAIFGDGDLGSESAAVSASRPLIADDIRIITCGLGGASATALDVISTENTETPRSAASESEITDSIAAMAQGLIRK